MRRSRRLARLAALAGLCAVLGCGPSRAVRRLDSGNATQAVRWSDDRITIHALPYSPQMDVDTFGVNLTEAQQLAVELRIENAKFAETVIVRRHDIVLVLENGVRRYPLDPSKVYEAQRVEKAAPILLFGISGAAVANATDDKRQDLFAEAALDNVRLDRDATSAAGFLFFDMSGTGGSRPDALVVEYEDSAGQTHTAKLDL